MCFEDLEIWKEGMRLCSEIYQLLRDCNDYGFRDQIRRSSVSIPSNISEGYERKSNKEFVHFLYIAKGSCGEMRTQLYLAIDFGYITTEKGKELIERSKRLSAMLTNYIKVRIEKF